MPATSAETRSSCCGEALVAALPVEHRDAGADQAVGEIAAARDPQPAVVEIGAGPLLGAEQLVLDRIVDHARDQLALRARARSRSRNAARRAGSWWCRRAGRRSSGGRPRPAERAALLQQEAEARPGPAQLLMQDLLGAVVGGADEVARPLDRDLQVLDLAEVAHEVARRLVGGLHHDVDVGRADRHEALLDDRGVRGPRVRRAQSLARST